MFILHVLIQCNVINKTLHREIRLPEKKMDVLFVTIK